MRGVNALSDNRFSIDDILNEHPKGENKSQSGERFDLDALLASKSAARPTFAEPSRQAPVRKAPRSAILSEVSEINDEQELSRGEELLVKTSKQGGAVNLVLEQKQRPAPSRQERTRPAEGSASREKAPSHSGKATEITATDSFRISESDGESNAFEAVENYRGKKEKRAGKPKKQKNTQMRREVASYDDAPMQDSPEESYADAPEDRQVYTEPKPARAKQPVERVAFVKESLQDEPTVEEILAQKPRKGGLWREVTSFIERSKGQQTSRLSFEGKDVHAISRNISGNTEIVNSLIRIKKERVSRTSLLSPISRKSISDIDLNLDDKILPNTEQILISESNNEMEKLKALGERRNMKIRDFVLVGDEEENSAEEQAEEASDSEINDFERFEDAPSIIHDIRQLKGSLLVRLFFLLITAFVSIYIMVANDFSFPLPAMLSRVNEPTTYLFINTILGLLSAFVSYTVISCGLPKIFTFRSDSDTISALCIVSGIISTMVLLANPALVAAGVVNTFIPIGIISLVFNTIGKLLIVERTAKNFQYISGDYEHYALFTISDEEQASQFTRGTLSDFPVLASMRKTEFVTDFLRNSYSSDITDKFCRILAPIVLILAVVLAFVSSLIGGAVSQNDALCTAFSTFAGSISLSGCLAVMLVINLPLSRAAKKYSESSSAMLSYQSVEEFADTNSVLIDVAQLFPQGMVNLSAIKIFSDTRIDEAIVEAASLTNHAGSILKHMFYDIIAGKTELLNPVESYIYEDTMGLCGWINNKRILLGNRELMTNHSIEGMPTLEREKEYTENGKSAVYLSISGELSAMFIIEIKPNLEIRRSLKELEKNEIYVMLRSVDSVISINKLAEMFEISPEMLKLIPFRLHSNYDDVTTYVPRQSSSLVCMGRFSSFASLIIGSKRMRGTASLGVSIQVAAAIVGVIMAIALTLLSSFDQLSTTAFLLYNLAWAGITVILQAFRKT